MNLVKKNVQHQVLDPCLLGRPVHRLPAFAAQLKEDLSQAMRLNMNRRYWGTFQVDSVEFSRLDGSEARARWLNFGAPAGDIAFALERKVLLTVLNYRYGRTKSDGALDDAAVKVTATEDRLAVVLGQQLAGVLAGRIEANLPRPGKAEGGADSAPEQDFHAEPGKQPPKGTWIITVTVSDHDTGGKPPLIGSFWFALDKHLMASVLHACRPSATAAAAPPCNRLRWLRACRSICKASW